MGLAWVEPGPPSPKVQEYEAITPSLSPDPSEEKSMSSPTVATSGVAEATAWGAWLAATCDDLRGDRDGTRRRRPR